MSRKTKDTALFDAAQAVADESLEGEPDELNTPADTSGYLDMARDTAGALATMFDPRDESQARGWCQTFTGRAYYPLDPQPETIDIRDIAHALAQKVRFTGHARDFYSIAEHSCRVESWVAEQLGTMRIPSDERPLILMAALLHDAGEAYLPDLPRPIKHTPIYQPIADLEKRTLAVIFQRFGLPNELPAMAYEVIKEGDNRLLATERRDLMGSAPAGYRWSLVNEPLPHRLHVWTVQRAEMNFLECFHTLDAWRKKLAAA